MTEAMSQEERQWFMNQPESFRRALNESVNAEQLAVGSDSLRSTIQLKHIRRARAVIDALAGVRNEDRADFMALVKMLFCGACWRRLEDGERCYCCNDE